jgi:MFS family permease
VCTNGTYNAILYDTLHERGMADQYSKIAGRAYALFLVGAGVANITSGFSANSYGYRTAYYVTVISCLLNFLLILTIHEPKFHRLEKKERILHQIKVVSRTMISIKLIRVLVIVLTALSVPELFKSEFGQLYMVRYFTLPQVIGLLWAVYAFTWSLGSLIAHKLRTRMNVLILFTVVPFIIMSFVDNWFSLVLFMLQAIAAAAFINQIETRIQENTPSAVRTSILSVVSTSGRIVSVPTSLVLGWLFRDYNALVALRFVAVISCITLLYWLLARAGTLTSTPVAAVKDLT